MQPHECLAPAEARGELWILWAAVRAVVSHQVGAGNETRVLCKPFNHWSAPWVQNPVIWTSVILGTFVVIFLLSKIISCYESWELFGSIYQSWPNPKTQQFHPMNTQRSTYVYIFIMTLSSKQSRSPLIAEWVKVICLYNGILYRIKINDLLPHAPMTGLRDDEWMEPSEQWFYIKVYNVEDPITMLQVELWLTLRR